ncbi:hypothetical protein H4R21_000727 [Coemansia helicoidea]|uniref:Uncharacterized protein n=1 Tax=Coemansia helicoidea TaxID=1286919 RepID=A0ACC1LF60_9FUNG|nr:hypothetical protein H4R21_000727 [Coemansia helicoidea]
MAKSGEERGERVRVGSRGSKLALTQSRMVVGQLTAAHAGLETELETVKTMGDKIQDVAMSKIGDKGLFTKELETALAGGAVDVVVHSLKDMPTTLPDNMRLAAVTEREDPRDAVVMGARHRGRRLEDLAAGSTVGTGSVRRVAQLRRLHPHLRFADIRGNIDTRLAKLDAADSPFDALVLAAAGLRRLGLGARIAYTLDGVLHAVGQGALGIETRADDARTAALVRCLDHRRSRLECLAERELMRVLEGGCSVPIGVLTRWGAGSLVLRAIVASPDGARAVEAEAAAPLADGAASDGDGDDDRARALGAQVAAIMRGRGVDEILGAIRRAAPPPP